jgi:hypothetical protein
MARANSGTITISKKLREELKDVGKDLGFSVPALLQFWLNNYRTTK